MKPATLAYLALLRVVGFMVELKNMSSAMRFQTVAKEYESAKRTGTLSVYEERARAEQMEESKLTDEQKQLRIRKGIKAMSSLVRLQFLFKIIFIMQDVASALQIRWLYLRLCEDNEILNNLLKFW